MQKFTSHSDVETESIGERLASLLIKNGKKSAFIAMYGEMGVGKTAFSRGVARALGIPSVKSPTYTIVNEYRSGSITLHHFDMYRIEDSDDLASIGFYDYLDNGYSICEWCENIADDIPPDAITVRISRVPGNESERIIEIDGTEADI